ncbi:MAG: efflux transporter outer membrane subunit [Deltaproteobacteria bacterium]|nr:efflux transporter outer membrane subunit [Deltaproteobacteria bacterium]
MNRAIFYQLVIGAALVLLSACSTARQPLNPGTDLPPRFSESGFREPSQKWWEDFADPELDPLIETALADNPSLRATWDRLSQAEAIVQRERAGLFPALEVGAEAGGFKSEPPVRRADFGFSSTASYELDLWGRVRQNTAAAAADTRALEAELQAAAISLSSTVATVWYELIEQRAQLDLLDRQIANNERLLELVTLRFRQGQVPAADVLRQRQLVEDRRGDRAEVGAEIKLREHALATLIGRAPTTLRFPNRRELINLPSLPATGVPAELLQRRPDVRQAVQRIEAADARVAVAIADRYPRIDLRAVYETTAISPSALFISWIATFVSQLTQPLFDAGRRAAEVDRTRAVASEAINNYRSKVLESLQEVEDALARERRQRELLASLVSQLKLASDTTTSLRDRYIQGAVNYLDILNATTSQQDLERRILSARRDLIAQRIALVRALAGGWTMKMP